MAPRVHNQQAGRIGFNAIMQATVQNVHMDDWTVDCYCGLTDRYYPRVQVAAGYLHHNAGEGLYCMPEIGAVCMVCIPSDSSPPFVLCFLAPPLVTAPGTEQDGGDPWENPKTNNPDGIRFEGGKIYIDDAKTVRREGQASFSCNRPLAKPGDITLRGRDGNFVTLHRGGVLQLGGSELAQRVYIPLQNLIVDLSERYEHHNLSGSTVWGMQEGQYDKRETEQVQTIRCFADDRYADVRVAYHPLQPCRVPDGDANEQELAGWTVPSIEVTVSPASFVCETGRLATEQAYNAMTFQFKTDRIGNGYIRFQGDVLVDIKGKLNIKTVGAVDLQGQTVKLIGQDSAELGSMGGATKVQGVEIKLGGGAARGVARLGDSVSLFIPPGMVVTGPLAIHGSITTASSTVKAE